MSYRKRDGRVVLSIPHCSAFIPDDIYRNVFLPVIDTTDDWEQMTDIKKSLIVNHEKYMMTDWYTDELFDGGEYSCITAEVSRLVCDIERFTENEDMEAVGMGFCYTSSFDLTPLKRVSDEHRAFVYEHYYKPYHDKLEELVDNALEKNGECVIVDCHSYFPIPLKYEKRNPLSAGKYRAQVCIGTDDYHTSPILEAFTEDFFTQFGYTVSLNTPFSGTIVPMKYYHRDSRVKSIMIELRRDLYMKGLTKEKNERFDFLTKLLPYYEKSLDEKYSPVWKY